MEVIKESSNTEHPLCCMTSGQDASSLKRGLVTECKWEQAMF